MTAAARTVNTKRGVRPGSVSASARTPKIGTMNSTKPATRSSGPGSRRSRARQRAGRRWTRSRAGSRERRRASRRMAPSRRSTAAAASAGTRREDDHQRRRAVGDRHDQRHRRENDRGGMPQRQGAGARGRDGRRNGGHAGANLVPSKPWRPIHKGVRCGPGKILVCCRPRRPGTLASARSGPGPSRVAGGASSVTPSFG